MKPSPTRVAALAALCALLLPAGPASAATTESAPGPVGGPRLGSTGVVVDAPAGTRPLPRLSARSFVLADAGSGDVLAARDPHGRLRPASTQKILTALTLLPELDPATVYTATFDDANVEGSKVGVVPDATYTVHNLFEGLILMSGNDAANALARAAGGVRRTVAKMNTTARELGALDTTVRNPSGLDAPGQLTSAYDLALLTRAGLAREDFRRYVGTVRSTFPGKMPRRGKARKTFEIWTQDKLLTNYRGAIGVKVGWTTKARGTFVGAATRRGRTLVATVMRTGPGAWEEAAALLDWGFANAAAVEPVGTLEQVRPAQPAPVRHAAVKKPAPEPVAAGAGMPPWFLWLVVALAGSVVALRTRVLLLRRRRRPAAARGRPYR